MKGIERNHPAYMCMQQSQIEEPERSELEWKFTESARENNHNLSEFDASVECVAAFGERFEL